MAAAVAGGADRIELCASLDQGGLTPSVEFMRVAAELAIPVRAMIRPRGGGFVFSDTDISQMRAEIGSARDSGLEGVVLGVARLDGTLDADILGQLVEHANGMGCTLHRVIDTTPDPVAAVKTARDIGFDCVLSSGGAENALVGKDVLAAMGAISGIEVMPGAGISVENAAHIRRATGARWIHGSFRRGQDVAAVRSALTR